MAWPDFAYDHYENAEDSTLDGWAETDPDGVLTLADATLPYNGSGSHSCIVDTLNSDTFLEGIHTAVSASIGFWLYTGTWNNNDSIQWFRISNDGFGTLLRLKLSMAGAAYTIADIDSADSVTVAAATWYWFTLQYNQNATSYWKLYNTVHDVVGSEQSWTAVNYALNRFYLFNPQGYDKPAGSATLYIDDIVIDHTDGTYPLLGWEAAGGVPIAIYKKYYDYRRMP